MDEPIDPKLVSKALKIFDTCLGVLKNLDQGPFERPHTIFAWFSRPPGKLSLKR